MASVEVPLPAGDEQVMVTVFPPPEVIGGVLTREHATLGCVLGGNVPVGAWAELTDNMYVSCCTWTTVPVT